MPAEAITPTQQPPATGVAAGTTLAAVRAALAAPSMATLPGRAALAWAEATPPWRGKPLRWRLHVAARGLWANLRARWLAFRSFDLRLACSRWRGQADGSATVDLDGISLRYAEGRLWLLVACPAGYPTPHEAALPTLPALAEVIVAGQAAPDLPPWGCPPACPGAEPAVLAAAGHPRLRPVPAPAPVPLPVPAHPDPDPDRDPGAAGVE